MSSNTDAGTAMRGDNAAAAAARGSIDRQTLFLRWMIRRDMEEVLEIERRCFDNPWNLDDFLHALRHRNVIGMVAESDNVIRGFMIYSLQKHSITLANIAVPPELHRCGIGRILVDKLVGKLTKQRRNRINAFVRDKNLSAQQFFRSIGFRAIGIERDCFEDMEGNPEDAYEFVYVVGRPYKHVPGGLSPRNRISGFYGREGGIGREDVWL